MSKNKTKITKWEYVTEPFDVWLHPQVVKRVHSPLPPSLTLTTVDKDALLHLRPCVQGMDEYGAVVKYLYCTRDGRFFVRGKDGWNEVKYTYNLTNKNYKGGSVHPFMRNFGGKHCHLCVAYAWHGARPEGMVCDHLDTNLLNLNATNFEWITVPENIRRAGVARQLRKIGIDPKRLTPTLMRGIFSLPEGSIPMFVEQYLKICANDKSQMLVENIRINVAMALDSIKSTIKDN